MPENKPEIRKPIFISYSSKNAGFVEKLRQTLDDCKLPVWKDTRELRAGDYLTAEIKKAIEAAGVFIVVFSPDAINSKWVCLETKHALEVSENRSEFRIIPILLEGVEAGALAWIFPEEPKFIRVRSGAQGIMEALPDLLAALGERLPDNVTLFEDHNAEALEELFLELKYPEMMEKDGIRRACASAELSYVSSAAGVPTVKCIKPFWFEAPLGPIDMEDLRWYVEQYYIWPAGFFKERAQKIAARMPEMGKTLFETAMPLATCHNVLEAWAVAAVNSEHRAERRFTVYVDSNPFPKKDVDMESARQAAGEATTLLLGLPWELLHDRKSYLFMGAKPVRVRRMLPVHERREVVAVEPPIRILLVSPRPEDETTGYIDHRISALPLVEAVETLGDNAVLTILPQGNLTALKTELERAWNAGKPYHVVHFDGHGVYDRRVGLGSLCFEDEADADKLEKRRVKLIDAEKLADVVRTFRIPFFFLEACQTARTGINPTASVAAALLDNGVASVVAMTHSVLVETARRFVTEFYKQLADGKRVGGAMLAAQRALKSDMDRGKVFGAGRFELEDWFVPVLFQEKDDPQLFTRIPQAPMKRLTQENLKNRLGDLPEPPAHRFVGRSRELLKLERLLCHEKWAVVSGQGGEGKTTLTVELVRWLVRANRFRRAVFVSFEGRPDLRTVIDEIGRQLIPDYSVTGYNAGELMNKALRPITRVLDRDRVLIVFDNMESVLPVSEKTKACGSLVFLEPEIIREIFNLCRRLLETDNARILFTSRESLPAPFDAPGNHIFLARLYKDDAIQLVAQVMTTLHLDPFKEDAAASTPPEIDALVDAVNCHARSLVLLAPHIHEIGLQQTTEHIHRLMQDIHQKFPNDREKSLFACVALSLQRLPQDMREMIRVLGVFHEGVNLWVLQKILNLKPEQTRQLAGALVHVGLAGMMAYGHLRLHPALSPYLDQELDAQTRSRAKAAWAEAMQGLTEFLTEQRSKNAKISAKLTQLELPNLLALLDYVRESAEPEGIADLAEEIEGLLASLGRHQILKSVAGIREQAARKITDWNNSSFNSTMSQIERLFEAGDLSNAIKNARALLAKSLQAGGNAYPGADYNLAMACFLLGRMLKESGSSEEALPNICEAQDRFEALADKGDRDAAHMASASLTEKAGCLCDLGRLDESAAAYEEGIRIFEKLENKRWVAVGKGQLATVRMLQKRYPEALAAYESARRNFEELDEPVSVAGVWHSIGMVYKRAGNFAEAENAYRKSLAIKVKQKNRSGEADSLGELGNLYNNMGRWEESVAFYRQAADIYFELKNMAKEGVGRNNIASTLIELKRFDAARPEIQRAIECRESFGHAVELWKTWNILHNLELATGNQAAAGKARDTAIRLFLAYRRDGGENHEDGGRLFAMLTAALQSGQTEEIEAHLRQLTHPSWKPLVAALQAILQGSHDLALAQIPALNFMDAAEVLLILERLR